MQQYVPLPRTEIASYFLIWISSIAYSMYQVYIISNEYFSDYKDLYNDFTDGWSWIGRKKDNADQEWNTGLTLLRKLLPLLCFHFTIAEIIKRNAKHLLPLWHIATGAIFVLYYLGMMSLIFVVCQPIFCFIIVQLRSKFVLWFGNICCLLTIHLYDWYDPNIGVFIENQYGEMSITMAALAWVNLRCLSYFLDATTNKEMQKPTINNVINVLSYCLYLPLLYYGPLILYSDFKKFLESPSQNLSFRLKQLFRSLVRFIFWLFFAEFLLHFVYVNALPFQTLVLREIRYFALYGLGYSMGQFFHMKYVVFYGLTTSLTQFELGINVPSIPKCIGRIHVYSDMWRYFDRGLYMFLTKYIYKPCANIKFGKIIGSFLCFVYVYVWHGTQSYIFIWSALNYLGVTAESITTKISKSTTFKNLITHRISPATYRRLSCLCASPLFAMSAISNFYFFAGKEVGDIFLQRFIHGPCKSILFVLAILYCGSHIALEFREYEERKKKDI